MIDARRDREKFYYKTCSYLKKSSTIYWYLQKFLHQSWRPRNFKFYKKSNFLKIIFECKRIWLRCVEQLTIKKLWWWYFMFSECFQLFIKDEIFGVILQFRIQAPNIQNSKAQTINHYSQIICYFTNTMYLQKTCGSVNGNFAHFSNILCTRVKILWKIKISSQIFNIMFYTSWSNFFVFKFEMPTWIWNLLIFLWRQIFCKIPIL